jgi:hypothetical protein
MANSVSVDTPMGGAVSFDHGVLVTST